MSLELGETRATSDEAGPTVPSMSTEKDVSGWGRSRCVKRVASSLVLGTLSFCTLRCGDLPADGVPVDESGSGNRLDGSGSSPGQENPGVAGGGGPGSGSDTGGDGASPVGNGDTIGDGDGDGPSVIVGGEGGSEDVSGSGSGDSTSSPPPVTQPQDCPEDALAPGNHNLSLEHDGETRTYIVHVPQGVNGTSAVPLVVDMHGLTSSAGAQASLSGWRAKADEEGFIVVHPQGLDASWNGGELCCGTSQRTGVDDEGFIRALVAQMESDACIDSKRVYATGLSNGGAMSHLLGCQAADLFAATAPVSMGNGVRACNPSRPISVVMTRGTQDTLVSFNGGLFPSAQEDFEEWAARNGCQGSPREANELCQVFTDCDGGVEVKTCTLNAGHVLYDNSQDFSVPDVVWETFERHTLP
jgi:polyhydroxybutyrate depolymerase